MNKKILTLGASIALIVVPAASAYAVDVTVNGVTWGVSPANLFVVDGDFGAYGLDGSDFAISEHGENSFTDYVCVGSVVNETEPDGDANVACGQLENSNVAGIEWSGSVKVFAGDQDGLLARQVVTLVNTTATDIVIDYEYSLDTEETNINGQPNARGTVGTQDGDFTVEDGETWFVGANENGALEAVAFGVNGFARGDGNQMAANEGFGVLAPDTIIDAEGLNNFYAWNDAGVTVPAGSSLNFVYFYYSIGAIDSGSTEVGAATDAEVNSLMSFVFGAPNDLLANSRLMEGLMGGAYNWVKSGEDDEEGLAPTGRLDATVIALGGVVILAAGFGLFASRRSRTVV